MHGVPYFLRKPIVHKLPNSIIGLPCHTILNICKINYLKWCLTSLKDYQIIALIVNIFYVVNNKINE